MQESKDLAIVKTGLDLIKSAPQILEANQLSVQRASIATQTFISKINQLGGKLNVDTDKEASELIVKVKATVKKMNDQRKPVTQIISEITKIFTAMEKQVEGLIDQLQPLRDSWAREVHEEAERKRKEAEAKAKERLMIDEAKAYIIGNLHLQCSNWLLAKKEKWQLAFNGITLADFDEKAEKLKKAEFRVMPQNFTLQSIVRPLHVGLTDEQWKGIFQECVNDFDILKFYNDGSAELRQVKQSLIDRLPSLKSELEEAAMASETERIRMESEKLRREHEEAARRAEEAAKAKQAAEQAANAAQAQAQAQTLFEQAVESAPESEAPESRKSYDITVLHPAGWVEIFQFWYTKEGVSMPVDEMGKKSLNQMKAVVEKYAKDGEQISSKFLKYEIAIKAVNRRAK